MYVFNDTIITDYLLLKIYLEKKLVCRLATFVNLSNIIKLSNFILHVQYICIKMF